MNKKPNANKGMSRWFPRDIRPTRPGFYECVVRIAGGAVGRWTLYWDGYGFRTQMPLVVRQWRGQTKAAMLRNARAHAAQSYSQC